MSGGSASEAASAELDDKPATAKMLRAVCDVGQRHFGERPRKIRRCGGGATNTVLEFKVKQGHFVFRMHEDAVKVHDYLKEQWAMDAARAAGVPAPRVLEVASLADGRPYMIMERVEGVDGRQWPDRIATVREIGALAARLHTVRTHGWGPVFDWSSNRLSQHSGWADYFANGFDAETRLRRLQAARMLGAAQVRALRLSIREAAAWRKPTVLQHGDLRLKNVLVDPKNGRIRALIDWETCLSSPAPFWDFSIGLHELGIDEREAFLEGYGMKPAQFRKVVRFVRMINVLNYAHAVHSATQRKNRDRLDWFRLRLAGELDLYES